MRTKTLVGISLVLAFLFLTIVFITGFILNPQNVLPNTNPLWIKLPKTTEENLSSLNLTIVEKSGNNGNLASNSGSTAPSIVQNPVQMPMNNGMRTRAS